MLRRWKVDVVAYGPSLHDSDSYYLMRAFPSVPDRQRSEDAFYSSDEWRNGPREATLADIVSYTTIVIGLDGTTIRGLRSVVRHTADPKEKHADHRAGRRLGHACASQRRLHPIRPNVGRPAIQRDPG